MSSSLAYRGGWLRRAREARQRINDAVERRLGDPGLRRRARAVALIGVPAALVVGGVGLWLWLRPVPQPDFLTDDLDSLFNYTMLTDEFNRLSVQERLGLIQQLVERLKGMDAGESAMMAAFAAGIAGAAREQIMENASRLMIDMMDQYAAQYVELPPEERAAFIDAKVIEMVRTMEAMDGTPTDRSDEEILAEGRRQAQRDMRMLSNPETRPSGRQAGRIFAFMREDMGGNATPQERARVAPFVRDMVRRMRGQDIQTGEGPR